MIDFGEPLSIRSALDGSGYYICTRPGFSKESFEMGDFNREQLQRIVDCVNACKGVLDPQYEELRKNRIRP